MSGRLREIEERLAAIRGELDNEGADLDDLTRLGIKKPEPEGGNGGVRLYGGLPVKAIEVYLKWQYDFMGKGEQYRRNYEALRTALSMSEGYYE